MPGELKIVPLQESSADDFKNVFRIYNDSFPESIWSEKYFKNYFFHPKENPLSFMFKIDGEIVGFVFGKMLPRSNSFNISSLWVSKKHRHKYFGKKLIEAIIKAASKIKNIEEIYLHFREKNQLTAYYEKLSFTSDGIDTAYSNGDRRYRMSLTVNNNQ